MPRTSDAKERLMDAVSELIWESSYGATSVDDICEKAGVKKGSFYHFFKSKSDLEVAALEAYWSASKPAFDRIFSSTVPPLERLSNYLDFSLKKQAEAQAECGCVLGCPLATIGTEVSTQDSAIRQKVEEIMNRHATYMESAIRDAHAQGLINAPDAKSKARALHAYLQGIMTQARIENSLDVLKDAKTGAMELLGVKSSAQVAA